MVTKREAKQRQAMAAVAGKAEFANISTPDMNMEDGSMKNLKYFTRAEARILVKDKCEHNRAFHYMDAIEMIKNHILRRFIYSALLK
ncbi:hypothetical protein PRIPAC_92460 [Pristionchus pacificus]|uniref:Uncharacterized protein n=1 Tax=Pristionchus pacificus TaxID=54126 RepID=A0A454XIC3_PRIPA|nr:hypothetical protein PRIPAC_92460 [Pristionchus pacificus]|eukprot:PDM80472.1 hypothetical protein PRIPAC_35464 [Pristionchus pacificus]